VSIDVGVAETGSGAVPAGGNMGDSRTGNRSKGVNGFVLNTITPETDTTCLYFWAFARNYCTGEQRLTHELREGVANIFREDEHVLEAQQQAMNDHPDHAFYNLNIDAGSMWARRLIDGLIAKEASPKPAKQVIAIHPSA
jgi:phenylpropionate dioxygenase-like ring-hydroxylating dioxygenase large terminal subunit